MARLTLVIETEIVRGKGTNADPLRRITQYWAVDGEERLLAESDDSCAPHKMPAGLRDDPVRTANQFAESVLAETHGA